LRKTLKDIAGTEPSGSMRVPREKCYVIRTIRRPVPHTEFYNT